MATSCRPSDRRSKSTSIDELKPEFIDRLKQMFSAGQVTIVVENHDETDYLLSNPANRDLLMKSIEQDRQSELVAVDTDEFLKKV